jgi:Zn-dependent protease
VYGLVVTIAVFISVILHELGHALAARSLGMKIMDISLYPFGGMARMTSAPKTTRDEILMAAAGPAVSLILAVAIGVAAWLTGNYTLWLLAKINLMLGAFNLLPALPMDGGRILRAYLARFYRATTVAARVARWLAMALAVFGVIYSGWFLVLAAFLLFLAFAEEGAARARQYLGDPGYQDAPRHTRPAGFPAPTGKSSTPTNRRPHKGPVESTKTRTETTSESSGRTTRSLPQREPKKRGTNV